MRYRCLVLDHDDTTVSSTPCIHYPAFMKILEELRPGTTMTQEDFLTANLSPGLGVFYSENLHLTPAEMQREQEIWKNCIAETIPPFFPGIPELIRRLREAGGFVCVVSHSWPDYIRRDYAAAGIPAPELIYGADLDPAMNKPNPWPLLDIMHKTRCKPDEMLMVDDLSAGLDMAHSAGIPFAASGWGYENPRIRDYMLKNADSYLNSVSELDRLLFPEEEE